MHDEESRHADDSSGVEAGRLGRGDRESEPGPAEKSREPGSVCATRAQATRVQAVGGGAGRSDSSGTIEPSIAPTAPPMSAPAATAGAATKA